MTTNPSDLEQIEEFIAAFDSTYPKQVALIRRAIAAIREKEWQPIETAPKDGTHILLWWDNQARLAWWLDNSKTIHPWAGWKVPSLQTVSYSCKPTHWMPLPVIPQSNPSKRDEAD